MTSIGLAFSYPKELYALKIKTFTFWVKVLLVSGFFWNLDTSKRSTRTKEEVENDDAYLLAIHISIVRAREKLSIRKPRAAIPGV